MIYLASPYSHPDKDVIDRRVRQVGYVTAKLIEQGMLVFSPIVHSHPICHHVNFVAVHDEHTDFAPGNTWLDYDKGMIDKCDALWVLRLDGWEASRGIAAELVHAHATGKPVQYVDYTEDVNGYRKTAGSI